MPGPLEEKSLSPRCEACGRDTARLGKLPRIGLRPLVHVYKCGACNQIMSVEPDQQEGVASA
jgi:DNA-directed RNA polymerase subunit RPC12/RpoP